MATKKANPLIEAMKRKEEMEKITQQVKAVDTETYPKLGRPRSKKTERLTLVIEPQDLKAFKRLCFETEINMSDYVQKWLHMELEATNVDKE